MNLIEQAKQEIPNFDKLVDKLNKRKKEFGEEGFEEYFNSQIRRELKKIKMNPPLEKDFFIIGCDIIDWAKIMRDKYGNIYPEGNQRAGEVIPDSDMSYTYYVYGQDQQIRKFNSKISYLDLIGKMVSIKFQENKWEILNCQFKKDVAHSEITFKEIPKVKIKNILKNEIPEGEVKGYLDRPLVHLSNVNLIDLRIAGELGIIKIDDNSVENLQDYLTMFIRKELINFTEDAIGLEVFGFIGQNQKTQEYGLNVISVYVSHDERFKLNEKPKPLEEEKEEENNSPLFG